MWPDNRPAAIVFIAMGTQWRVGAAGRTGLDYAVLPELWRRCRVPPCDRDQVFSDLRVIEDEALTAMYEKD